MQEGAFVITLGGKDIELPPLTLNQVKRICVAIPNAVNGFTEAGFDSQIEIVHAGLVGLNPDLTKEQFGGWVMTQPELMRAADTVVKAAGFGKKEAGTGEAMPGEAPANA